MSAALGNDGYLLLVLGMVVPGILVLMIASFIRSKRAMPRRRY
jgi:hypothetical protein